jgi:lipoprotein-anchoring transpeptidase ErfK/SrfK
MADPGSLGAARDALPVRGLADSALSALDGCLLLNESEVEGRGLLEAVLSVSMLAMVFSDPGRPAPPQAPPPVIESVVETADLQSVSEPLTVKSQKLRQPPPLVYPNVIQNAQGCEHKVIVDISAQRAFVFIDGQLAFETPVSSASKGRHTPRGTFKVTEKIRSGKRSTIYKSLMPYWMRLDQSAIGMHTGQLPGYPASHGCVRMPDESARFIFDLLPKGATVQIVDSLKPAPAAESQTIVAGR